MGFEEYFASHECGPVCQALKLHEEMPVVKVLQEVRERMAEAARLELKPEEKAAADHDGGAGIIEQ